MKLYRYTTDPDTYQAVAVSSEDDERTFSLHFETRPRSRGWAPLVLKLDQSGPKRQGDFPSLGNYSKIPVFTERAWNVLRPLIQDWVEALPVIHPSGKPYFIINTVEELDCLDEEKSEVTRRSFDDRITWVYAFAFKPGVSAGKHIFKTAVKTGGDLIVSHEFRRVVETNRLKGLVFRELPMVGAKKRPQKPDLVETSTQATPPRRRKQAAVTAMEAQAIENQIEHALAILGVPRSASPDEIQEAIYEEINRVRTERRRFDAQTLDNMALGLGCLWGQAVCDRLGWRWASITLGDTNAVGVISPNRSHVTFPMGYINALIRDSKRDQTSLLTYNMLKEGAFPGKAGSYTVVE